MARIGIIGTGNMGGMLASAFAKHADVNVTVFNRTTAKAMRLAAQDLPISVAGSIEELARNSEVIFLCTKAADGLNVIRSLGPLLSPAQVLATTISTIPIAEWESWTEARVVKVIPSIAQQAASGILLITFGARFAAVEFDQFEQLAAKIATPFIIDERQVRLCSDLTSCSPAFLSALLLQWAQAASETGQISAAEAEHLLCASLLGTAKLMERGLTLQDIVGKVAVPGGVTEAGLTVLRPAALSLFRALHEATRQHQHPPAQ